MSLLFYMLSRFVIAFLPRIKSLLISWLQSLFRVHCCYLHYYGTSATIKNIRMIPYYQLNFTLCLDFLFFFILFFWSRILLRIPYYIKLSCLLGLLLAVTVSQICLWGPLKFWGVKVIHFTGSQCMRICLIIFSWLDWGYGFEDLPIIKCCFHHIISREHTANRI